MRVREETEARSCGSGTVKSSETSGGLGDSARDTGG